MKIVPALLLAALPAAANSAPLILDPAYTSHAVFQRGREIPVSGTAEPGSNIGVTFDGEAHTAKADSKGRWQVTLPRREAGGPYVMKVSSGGEEQRLDDIMVGDVWLCSGQSNMEFALRYATNAMFEVPYSTRPMLRLLNVPRQSSTTPQQRFSAPAAWQRSAPESAADFSAACYIMGRELQDRQKIPIGLIAASWGGSPIEEWISRDALQTLPRYRADLALMDQYARDPGNAASTWAKLLQQWLGGDATAPAKAVWRTVPNKQMWEQWGDPALATFDGIGYYRARVKLTAAQAGKPARIVIGAVDDIDVTRINGKIVGADQGWQKKRDYEVPAGALKAGENIIDVMVVDTGGGGGLVSEAARTLTLGDGTVLPLSDWTFAKGRTLKNGEVPPSVPWTGGAGRTTLFNGMIAPLRGYPLTGFAWYQGEANVSDANGYAELMPLLIADWRKRFDTKPFLMVQLANFGPLASVPSNDNWGQLRDVQRRVADADPQVGMASAVDIGQVGDIHPTNKQDVGKRLALAARHIALGEDVEDRGPAPISVARTAKGIAVRFAHGPLKLVGGGSAIGFELCNAAASCRFVNGELDGETILLPVDPDAREVRYLWQASPIVNLYNAADLPATGFSMPIK
ncbi:sialate O-acetylesterase [Sphingobium sp. OAS761]|uniref:sialate O-acetylesterase n=1 Tax=Sphingobium sp. OAS761 TaxID=2817901 RepID=UPI00209C96F2|nr:sialate O-acetylesterase [Sphingobium sp. OAS761]MCP1469266.1 sialate O-acetylesterase [Sphingobium sp. OAS761]